MAGRTRVVGTVVLAAAVLNAVLNVILIPRWGAMGAAVATVISYAVLAGISAYQARQQLSIAYPWTSLAIVLTLVLGLYTAGALVGDWGWALRMGIRLGLLFLYGLGIVSLGVYPWSALREGIATIRSKRT
jgi:O-antigen/teichoic acid export membrane protein